MSRERKILLILLAIIIFISLISAAVMMWGGYSDNKKRIENLYKQAASPFPNEKQIKELEAYANETRQSKTFSEEIRFNSKEVSFYDFTDLIIQTADKNNIEIRDYQTSTGKDVPQLILTGKGSISNLLNFLNFLDSYPVAIEIPYIHIGKSNTGTAWELAMRLNYISTEM